MTCLLCFYYLYLRCGDWGGMHKKEYDAGKNEVAAFHKALSWCDTVGFVHFVIKTQIITMFKPFVQQND